MEVLFADSIGIVAPFGHSVVVCVDVSTNVETVLHTEVHSSNKDGVSWVKKPQERADFIAYIKSSTA
ncbi:hypothetical protein AgCh_028203 [Apium graveolens]